MRYFATVAMHNRALWLLTMVTPRIFMNTGRFPRQLALGSLCDFLTNPKNCYGVAGERLIDSRFDHSLGHNHETNRTGLSPAVTGIQI